MVIVASQIAAAFNCCNYSVFFRIIYDQLLEMLSYRSDYLDIFAAHYFNHVIEIFSLIHQEGRFCFNNPKFLFGLSPIINFNVPPLTISA